MKVSRWITSIIMALILLPLSIQAAEKKETPKRLAGVAIIDASTVKQWLDNGDDFITLDARKTPDYEAGHLPDAELCTVPSDLNLSEQAVLKSVQALENYEFLKDLEKNTKIITYCNSYT